MLSWVDYDKWQQPFSRKKNICSRTTKGAPSQFNWTFEEKYGWVYPYSKNSDDQSCFRWMLQIQPARGSKVGKSTNDTMFHHPKVKLMVVVGCRDYNDLGKKYYCYDI